MIEGIKNIALLQIITEGKFFCKSLQGDQHLNVVANYCKSNHIFSYEKNFFLTLSLQTSKFSSNFTKIKSFPPIVVDENVVIY